jgi:hypothetical protein
MAENTGDTRYANRSGSGSNEPPDNEKKQDSPDWEPRQGGAQNRDPRDAAGDLSRGKGTRGNDEVATRRHLEGSVQGPS